MLRKLLSSLLFLSVAALSAPLFSDQTIPEDSINVGYTVTNTTFEDTVDIDALEKPKEVYPLIVLSEVLGFNGFVWAWDRYVLDKGYARTGPSYWKRNFKEGWEWDHNHWAINFYGHPYQGAT